MPFDFAFSGKFFRLRDFLARLDRFTEVAGEDVTVRGRLLSVDGFSLVRAGTGSSRMLAAVRATAYLLPRTESAPVTPLVAAPAMTVPTTPAGATP